MDWLGFVSKLIEDLSWPVAIVLIVFLLRKPLRDAIRDVAKRLTKVDVGAAGVTVALSLQAESMREVLESATPIDQGDVSAAAPVLLRELAVDATSPRELINSSLESVSKAVEGLVATMPGRGGLPQGLDLEAASSLLALHGEITQSLATAIAGFAKLHQRLAAVPDTSLTKDVTRRFVELSTSIIVRIEAVRETLAGRRNAPKDEPEVTI